MVLSRLFQLGYYRATGEVWSPSMSAIGLRPSRRWVLTGRDRDLAGESIGDAIARGWREAMEEQKVRGASPEVKPSAE